MPSYGSTMAGNSPAAQIRLHVELPLLQASPEHLVEFPRIVLRSLPLRHAELSLDGVVHISQRQGVPLRAIIVREIV